MESNLNIKEIPIKDISDNPYQPRKRYERLGIKNLAKNISERGLLHPIAVVKLKDKNKFIAVFGHRRIRAYKYLRRKKILASIRKQSTKKDLALDIAVENALRKDFIPIEKSKAIFQALCTIDNVNNDLLRAYCIVNQVKLMNKRGIEKVKNQQGHSIGMNNEDILKCERILNLLNISENTAITYLRLLDLPKELQDKIVFYNANDHTAGNYFEKGFISLRYGYELSRIKDNKLRVIIFEKIINERLRYKQLKCIVDELIKKQDRIQFNKKEYHKIRERNGCGVEALTKKAFKLSDSLRNFKEYMPFMGSNIDQIILGASLKKLRTTCLNLVQESDNLLEKLNNNEKE